MFLRIYTVAALSLLLSFPALACVSGPDRYEIDKSHTRILFYVNHLGFADTVGDFTQYSGNFHFDEKNPEQSSIHVVLNPMGIRTSSAALDSKIQGESYFNSTIYPDITFDSKSVTITGKNTGLVLGDLTMLGVTKPVTLDVTFNKAAYHPYTQKYVAGFSAKTTVKRSEFGMDILIPGVSDEVRVEIQIEGINQVREKAESIKKKTGTAPKC